MLFSTPLFLFGYLPAVLGLYFLSPHKWRNGLLLGASLFFFAWGEKGYTFLLLFSTAANYGFARWMMATASQSARSQRLAFAIAVNLGVLIYYKYTGFLLHAGAPLLQLMGMHTLAFNPRLPLGISFYTFHALSYLIDLYRGTAKQRKSLGQLALYISFFPQLIAGPIVRYADVAEQIEDREVKADRFSLGIERFIFGLAKKVLIADYLGQIADHIFSLPSPTISTSLAYIAVISYTMQIYFDFSGYSDMAIGLARLFGFEFKENFHYPYSARSIQDFWRRWHISLSTWFRDYLYIPLGGSRKGTLRTSLNLFIVFALCGLWHGASLQFLVWGLFHGAFLALERTPFGSWLAGLPRLLQHGYTLSIVAVGWVFFRSESMGQALQLVQALAGFGGELRADAKLVFFINHEFWFTLGVAAVLSMPVFPYWMERLKKYSSRWNGIRSSFARTCSELLALGLEMGLFLLACARLAGATYSPFIYFRF